MEKKVYIAAAFRRFSDRSDANTNRAYGVLKKGHYIDFLEKIEQSLVRKGYVTCLPHRDEGRWGEKYYPPETISSICLRHVATSEIILAVAEEGRGVHIELGFAAGLGEKTILLFYHENHEPSTLIWGLSTIGIKKKTNVKIYKYKTYDDIEETISKTLPDIRDLKSEYFIPFQKAIIDIGSHSLKVKIFKIISDNRIEEVYSNKNSIGLIDSLRNNELSVSSLEKLRNTLASWHKTIQEFDCKSVKVVGTEALRKSTNVEEVNIITRDIFNTNIEVLSKEEEHALLMLPINKQFQHKRAISVLNLGGGSVQFSIIEQDEQVYKVTLDFGTNYISSRWKWESPISLSVFKDIINYVKSEIRIVNTQADKYPVDYMIHTGGELDFLLSCYVPLEVCNISKTHVSQVSRRIFLHFAHQFCSNSIQEASTKYNLDTNWLKGSVASNAIAIAFMESFKIRYLVPSNLNISDGISLH